MLLVAADLHHGAGRGVTPAVERGAGNLDEALTIAKDCPDLTLGGSVEVRDVVVFE